MIKKIKNLVEQKKPLIKTISSLISILAPLAFALFNLFLGITHKASWNLSIGIYYLLLLIVRVLIYITGKSIKKEDPSYLKFYIISSAFLFVMNLSLALPIYLLVLNKREVTFSTIIGIAMATYTTYKVIASIINYKKAKAENNLIQKERRRINIYDALVSILTLQNALIAINSDTIEEDMRMLTIISSFIIYSLIVISSLVYFVLDLRKKHKKTDTPSI